MNLVLYHVICIGKPNYVPVWKISSTKLVLSVSVLSFSAAITFTQYLVLSEEEGQQHQHASIVNHPPHVNGALLQPVLVSGETVHIFSHKQRLMGRCGLPHCLWMKRGRERGLCETWRHCKDCTCANMQREMYYRYFLEIFENASFSLIYISIIILIYIHFEMSPFLYLWNSSMIAGHWTASRSQARPLGLCCASCLLAPQTGWGGRSRLWGLKTPQHDRNLLFALLTWKTWCSGQRKTEKHQSRYWCTTDAALAFWKDAMAAQRSFILTVLYLKIKIKHSH